MDSPSVDIFNIFCKDGPRRDILINLWMAYVDTIIFPEVLSSRSLPIIERLEPMPYCKRPDPEVVRLSLEGRGSGKTLYPRHSEACSGNLSQKKQSIICSATTSLPKNCYKMKFCRHYIFFGLMCGMQYP